MSHAEPHFWFPIPDVTLRKTDGFLKVLFQVLSLVSPEFFLKTETVLPPKCFFVCDASCDPEAEEASGSTTAFFYCVAAETETVSLSLKTADKALTGVRLS